MTEISALETFSTTPVWYTALPSDVKAYYDKFNKGVQDLVDQAILGETKNATTSDGGAKATGSTTGAQPKETGGAATMSNTVGLMGAGIAVAFAGVLAL